MDTRMNQSTRQRLLERLQDERSKRVIFVSHCVDELVDGFQQEGLDIYQMRCPEQRAWGGVLKRSVLHVYGSKGTLLYRLRHVLLPFFIWYTRLNYARLVREVVRDIEDYIRSGFEVVGIVGVGGSPSCGVCTTLDLGHSLEAVAGCPLAQLDRQVMNETAIAGCLCKGEGLFMEALQRRLRRKRFTIRWYEHELLNEIRGQPIRLRV
jgi:hypothetical protein